MEAVRAALPVAQDAPALAFFQALSREFSRRRACEVWACVAAAIGVLCMLVENELLMQHAGSVEAIHAALFALKALASISTLVLLVLIERRYAASAAILRLQRVSATASKHCGSSGYSIWLYVELLVCSFHIPPGIEGFITMKQIQPSGDSTLETVSCPRNSTLIADTARRECFLIYRYPVEVLGIFMLVRLYLLARCMRSSSPLYSQWVALVGSMNNVDVMKPLFHFKALFRARPLHLLLAIALLNTLLTAAVVRILEHPVQAVFGDYWKAVWLAAMTMSATGIGDYYPITDLGRAVLTVSAVLGGVLLLALAQSLFFSAMELSPNERKVKHLIDTHHWENDVRDRASRLLQAAWRLHQSPDREREAHLLEVLYRRIRECRRLRNCPPECPVTADEQVAAMENELLVLVKRQQEEQARVLDRIERKAAKLREVQQHLQASD